MTDLKRKYSWFIKITASLTAFFIFLLLSEIFLSFLDFKSSNENPFFPINQDINFPEIYELDSELFWKFRKNSKIVSEQYSKISYRINALGLRGKEIANTVEVNNTRILALGNSCTFGWGLIENDIWVRRLERILSDSLTDFKIQVINAGIPGYSTYQGLKSYKNQLVQLNPEFVLIMYGWNDHWPAGKNIEDKNQESSPKIILEIKNILGQLHTYRALRKLILKMTDDSPRIQIDDERFKKRVSKNDFVLNLHEIIKIAIKDNCTPILIVPPLPRFSPAEMQIAGKLVRQHSEYQALIRSTANYLNLPLVDLQVDFFKHDSLFDNHMFDPIHFNAKGHDLAATRISKILLPYFKKMNENGI